MGRPKINRPPDAYKEFEASLEAASKRVLVAFEACTANEFDIPAKCLPELIDCVRVLSAAEREQFKTLLEWFAEYKALPRQGDRKLTYAPEFRKHRAAIGLVVIREIQMLDVIQTEAVGSSQDSSKSQAPPSRRRSAGV